MVRGWRGSLDQIGDRGGTLLSADSLSGPRRKPSSKHSSAQPPALLSVRPSTSSRGVLVCCSSSSAVAGDGVLPGASISSGGRTAGSLRVRLARRPRVGGLRWHRLPILTRPRLPLPRLGRWLTCLFRFHASHGARSGPSSPGTATPSTRTSRFRLTATTASSLGRRHCHVETDYGFLGNPSRSSSSGVLSPSCGWACPSLSMVFT